MKGFGLCKADLRYELKVHSFKIGLLCVSATTGFGSSFSFGTNPSTSTTGGFGLGATTTTSSSGFGK